MAFVRYKTVKGRKYYQLVRNYREGGKHRQQVLCHLGQHRSLDEAIDYEKSMVSDYSRAAARQEEEAASTKAYLFEFYGDRFNGELPSREEAYRRHYRQFEEEPIKSIDDYYKAKDDAERNRYLAEEHQDQLDKYLAARRPHG